MLKHLRFRRPLVFLDVETTGVDPYNDRIVEIAMVRFTPGAARHTLEMRFNPERPIPPAATAIHGIRDEDVANCATFAFAAERIAGYIHQVDLAGFGIAHFDLPFLVAEFERAGWNFTMADRKIIDALTLFHRLEPRDLAAAVRRYCGCEHTGAHTARQDAKAAALVLDAMLNQHRDVPRTVEALHNNLIEVDVEGWFRLEGKVVVFARGKHRDVPLEDVARNDASYLEWLAERVLPDARQLIDKALRSKSDRNDR
jgi:DNA polymerase-3 subunit epsilon